MNESWGMILASFINGGFFLWIIIRNWKYRKQPEWYITLSIAALNVLLAIWIMYREINHLILTP